jgi:hypothetical protein
MNKRLVVLLVAVGLTISACCFVPMVGTSTVRGSGNAASETRNLRGFSSIVLKGSADVDVTVAEEPGPVVVEAEDNIIPLIETRVQFGRLIISTRPNTNIAATRPVRIGVTMKALDSIRLEGSGNIQASDLNGTALEIDLPGSGNITVTGTVDKVKVTMRGSGQIICSGLRAKAATVNLPGSGNVTVYASESLDATLKGSGNIQYSGNPATVRRSITGSGNIGP